MQYQYLQNRGALNDVSQGAAASRLRPPLRDLPPHVIEQVPESVAREQIVIPISVSGETLTLAAANPSDIGFIDKLTFILNKKVRLVPVPRDQIIEAINHHYGQTETESVDSMLQEFTDTAIDFEATSIDLDAELAGAVAAPPQRKKSGNLSRYSGKSLIEFKKGMKALHNQTSEAAAHGQDITPPLGGSGMFFHVVEEGQRVLMRRPDGTMDIVVGPRKIWQGRNIFQAMKHFVAHPGEFLIVRYRDGRQEHVAGPAEVWLDPRAHKDIQREDALQLAAKEAVVVYSRSAGASSVTRRIEYGPAQFVPQPGEWLHRFSWHASQGGHLGVQKIPNGLVFQKLWLMPDQMYHDVTDVRTADDAVLTVRLMIFFELIDIERMLDTTHDPIGDFVNAATSDVIAFTSQHDFESFKRNTSRLNELEAYGQLGSRASQCGYRINKVVYRGYGAPTALQQMHDQAIQARTKLQLDRATEQQAQDLENYRLDCQITRSDKRRTEQTTEVEHDLELARRKQEAELRQKASHQEMVRQQRRLEAEQQLELKQKQDSQQRDHLAALRGLEVDLTAFLTQARADKVIELRGAGAGTHLHLEPREGNGKLAN